MRPPLGLRVKDERRVVTESSSDKGSDEIRPQCTPRTASNHARSVKKFEKYGAAQMSSVACLRRPYRAECGCLPHQSSAKPENSGTVTCTVIYHDDGGTSLVPGKLLFPRHCPYHWLHTQGLAINNEWGQKCLAASEKSSRFHFAPAGHCIRDWFLPLSLLRAACSLAHRLAGSPRGQGRGGGRGAFWPLPFFFLFGL